ncbi:MAG: ribonuclease P protein component [Pseudomonadales bacterium]|nr:ribonuclease P protein component [Pseudomonadales bacterium]
MANKIALANLSYGNCSTKLIVNTNFTREARLLNSKQFQFVFDHVDYKASNKNILLLSSNNDIASSRLGLIISKKKLKRAVDRNRVKRIARESFRFQQDELAGLDILVLSRNELINLSNKELRGVFDRLWFNLIQKKKKGSG